MLAKCFADFGTSIRCQMMDAFCPPLHDGCHPFICVKIVPAPGNSAVNFRLKSPRGFYCLSHWCSFIVSSTRRRQLSQLCLHHRHRWPQHRRPYQGQQVSRTLASERQPFRIKAHVSEGERLSEESTLIFFSFVLVCKEFLVL